MKRSDDVELAHGYTVGQYRMLEAAKDRKQIATLIRRRFTDRYLTPVLSKDNVKHGFCSMAIGCLMLEAMESFRQGWPDTSRKSREAFCSFFDGHDEFADFRGHASQFYFNVRCGILHQGETRDGWLIRRGGTLFDAPNQTVNATKFLRRLEKVLKAYCRQLEQEEWEGKTWKACRRKMNALCDTCV